MLNQDELRVGLTFDDVLLVPAASDILPKDADLTTKLTNKITLQIPLMSAAMDTVTESAAAICMAQEGGIGIVHKNLTIEEQTKEVIKVKKAESGIVVDPVTVLPGQKISEALELMRQHNISGLPVVTKAGKVEGIITNRDVRFELDLDKTISEVMTKKLITAPEGITLDQSKALLHKNRIEKLIVVDKAGKMRGLITMKDIEKAEQFPFAAKDEMGRLRVGAAIGVGQDRTKRVKALLDAGADVIIIDTAHGHSNGVINAVREVRRAFPEVQLIAGNIATGEGALALIKAGVDAVKVGIGPGSICTTRIVSGVGMPQITAIADCARVAKEFDIPVIADGGIKHSGDIGKAIAAGANSVMIGSMFAGTDESPGEVVFYQGRSYKTYRGMGSIGAMQAGSKDRYFQGHVKSENKLVPEGIEGRVPYKGSLSKSIYQLLGGLRSSMGYVGCGTIDELRQKAQFVQITSSGLRESHVHDVIITKEAPNYTME